MLTLALAGLLLLCGVALAYSGIKLRPQPVDVMAAEASAIEEDLAGVIGGFMLVDTQSGVVRMAWQVVVAMAVLLGGFFVFAIGAAAAKNRGAAVARGLAEQPCQGIARQRRPFPQDVDQDLRLREHERVLERRLRGGDGGRQLSRGHERVDLQLPGPAGEFRQPAPFRQTHRKLKNRHASQPGAFRPYVGRPGPSVAAKPVAGKRRRSPHDIALDPVQVGFFGTVGIVFQA